MELTHNDFFCGGGGIGMGFKKAGFKLHGAWDWDKYAIMSYKENVGENVDIQDISEMTYDDLEPASVWTFGFPCVDISIAQTNAVKANKGGKIGLDGESSGNFFHIMRLLQECHDLAPEKLPAVLMAENVAELDKLLDVVEREYNRVGYKMYARLYNAKHWLAQSRERWCVIGIREDLPQTFEFTEEPKDKVHRIIDILEEQPDLKHYYNADDFESIQHEVKLGEINVIGRFNGGKGWLDYMKRVYGILGVAPTLNTCQGGHRQAKIMVGGNVRRLTPREYTRLTGFDDDYKFIVSESQIYKQMGNAVPVPMAQAWAGSIKRYLEGLSSKYTTFVERSDKT